MSESVTVDSYIASFAPEIQQRLEEIRSIMRQALPEASERIAYQMPTFYQGGNVIHYAAWQEHIGIYPGASGIKHFAAQLQGYNLSKGCIRLAMTETFPSALIAQLCQFRLAENLAKIAARKARKAAEEGSIEDA